GKFISGAMPFETFKGAIDEQIRKADELLKSGTKKEKLYQALVEENVKAAGGSPQAAAPGVEQKFDVQAGNAPAKGAKTAPVTIIEFSDFQCPYCGRAQSTLKQVLDQYPGKVRLVWKNQPLSFHPNAMPAAEAAMAAVEHAGPGDNERMADPAAEARRPRGGVQAARGRRLGGARAGSGSRALLGGAASGAGEFRRARLALVHAPVGDDHHVAPAAAAPRRPGGVDRSVPGRARAPAQGHRARPAPASAAARRGAGLQAGGDDAARGARRAARFRRELRLCEQRERSVHPQGRAAHRPLNQGSARTKRAVF